MKTISIICICLVFINSSFAQSYKSDRPQTAISGEIVPIKTFAIETGFDFQINKKGNYSIQYNETLVRIGMMKLMEMTVGFKIPATLQTNGITNQHQVGFASPKLGMKVFLKQKDENTRMGIAFIFDGSINFGSKDFKDTKILPSFRVAADVDLNEKTNLLLNYGAEWRENWLVIDPEGNPVIDPFIVLAGSISHTFKDKHILFVGVNASVKYNNFRSNYFAQSGYMLKLKNNMQLDVAASAGLSPKSPRAILQLGFSGVWPKKNMISE